MLNLKHVKVLHVFCPVFTDKKLKESNLETLFILYGMIAALCVSLIVNGCMIKWYVNQTLTFHIQFSIYIFVHMIYLIFNTLNILNINSFTRNTADMIFFKIQNISNTILAVEIIWQIFRGTGWDVDINE